MKPAPPLIVHVVYHFGIGGLENGIVNLLNRLPADAWRHTIVSLTDIDETFRSRIVRDDVQFVALRKPPGHAIPLYPALYRMFKAMAPAIVHTRNLAALETSVPAWAAGVPARVHGEHGRDAFDPDMTNLRRRLIRRTFRPFVTRYVALSSDLAQYLTDGVGVAREAIDQICNGVDSERFSPSAARAAPAGCPFTDPTLWLVGAVGRLEAVKDQGNLAAAFVSAVRSDPEARKRMRLIIVGEGPLRNDVEAILDAAQMRELAWLPGERHDVPDVLRGLDAFVLPSRAEGVSNTVLEAMASGLPVVATAVGANADLVTDGVCGTIVRVSDSDALADAMLAYFRNPDRAHAHARAARARAVQRFSLERMVERYHGMYSAMLDVESKRARVADVDAGSRSLRH